MKRSWLSFGWMLLLLFSCKGKNGSAEEGTLPPIEVTDEDPAYANFRAEPFQRTFKGKLDGQYPITMQLKSEDGVELHGIYTYDGKMGATYKLSGSQAENGTFFLGEEDEQGRVRSSFDGSFHDRHWMDGHWSAAEGGEPMPFLLGDGFSAFGGASDSVPGFRGVFMHRRAVYGAACKCWLRFEYPQLLGVAEDEVQDLANRELRIKLYELMQVEEVSSSDPQTYSFETTFLSPAFFSGRFTAEGEAPLGAAVVVNLTTGYLLYNNDLIRNEGALSTYLQALHPDWGDVLTKSQLWLSKEGISLRSKSGHEVLIPWSHPQLHSWFRNLPPSV